jgi:energy-converting hydrogenase Eha subunit A
MAKCPNCDATIAWDAANCPKCSAKFGKGAAWRPEAESPDEARLLNQGHVPPEPYAPSGLALANLSLGTAFALSALFSPGGRILKLVLDLPVVQSMQPYQGHLLNVMANYLLPAISIYLLLRFTRVAAWLKPSASIHAMVGVGNALLVLYLSARVFASTIQGGGPSFIVMSWGIYVIIPAWCSLGGAAIWLTARSVSLRNEILARRPLGILERAFIVATLAIPTVFFWKLFFDETGPFHIARAADKLFRDRCQIAGERILRKPGEDVKGLYLEQNSSPHFMQISNGVYGGHEGGLFGEAFVNSGALSFFEEPNRNPRPGQEPIKKYRRYSLGDPKWQFVEQLESRYGVYSKALAIDTEQKLGIGGSEVRIVVLATNETIATTTYFFSSRQRRFCGNVTNGEFSVSDFIARTFSLRRKSPLLPQGYK